MRSGRPWSLAEAFFRGPRRLSVKAGSKSIDRLVAIAVAEMLKDDSRSRDELAEEISLFSGERITRFMLDAYASPARDAHPIPAHRLLILAQMTGRWDLIDSLVSEFGSRLLTADDERTFEIGLLCEQRAALETLIDQRLNETIC